MTLKNLSIVAAGATTLALGFGSVARAASFYNLTRIRPSKSPFIGNFPINGNFAVDINENGEVIGNDISSPRVDRVFLWDRTNGARVLPTEPTRAIIANAINDAGLVVATSLNYVTNRAILWDANGISQKLPPLETNRFDLYMDSVKDLNNLGQAVGASEGQAVLWENSQIFDLGIAGEATAINESSWIVGNRDRYGGNSGTFLLKNGQITDLSGLNSAIDINDRGQVVGASTCGSSTCASLWDNGTLTQFGSNTEAQDINNLGWVVGSTITRLFEDQRALLWKNGQAIDLNTLIDPSLGWTLWAATAINDKGQIVGYGSNRDAWREAFLLTPVESPTSVPEPTALLGLAVMGAGLALSRRYRR